MMVAVLQLRAPHQTLTKEKGGKKTTPAMAAGVTNHVWTYRDIAALLDLAPSWLHWVAHCSHGQLNSHRSGRWFAAAIAEGQRGRGHEVGDPFSARTPPL